MIKYLPLGTVVLLKGGAKKMLIIGRGLGVPKGDKTYFFDYAAALYPEGMTSDQVTYFNHENISKVVFEGYSDVDDENIAESINKFLDETEGVLKGDVSTWNEQV